MSDSLQYLGNSQGFVGVLATVIIMCVLTSDSNFIFKILEDIANNFQRSIKEIPIKVSFDELLKDNSFKLINFKINKKMKKILFAAFAVVAMSFASCGNQVKSTETVDSTAVDTVNVDSVNTDSVCVD